MHTFKVVYISKKLHVRTENLKKFNMSTGLGMDNITLGVYRK